MVLASPPASQSFAIEAATVAAVFFVAVASSAKKIMKMAVAIMTTKQIK